MDFKPTSITISSETYDRLMSAVERNAILSEEIDRLNKENLKNSLKYQTIGKHLSNFLDEFEGAWDNEHECVSPEIAQQYIEAAKFMSDHFKRINNRILEIEQWYNKFVPEDLQKP